MRPPKKTAVVLRQAARRLERTDAAPLSGMCLAIDAIIADVLSSERCYHPARRLINDLYRQGARDIAEVHSAWWGRAFADAPFGRDDESLRQMHDGRILALCFAACWAETEGDGAVDEVPA